MACYDCGLEYGSVGWIEAIIPDKVWDMIRPEGSGKGCGILCINCISRRLARKGLKKIPVWLCGTEPLEAVSGSSNLSILRNWVPDKSNKINALDPYSDE